MADLTIHNWPRKIYTAYLRGGKFGNNYFEKILLNEKFIDLEIKKGKEEGKVRIITTRNEM